MIISKTPFRVSFFGGGTDFPQFYRAEGGAVLSTAIDKYCYLSCRPLPPFFGYRHRVVWSHIETVGTLNDILHPAVREGLRFLDFDDSVGLEIHHQGDLPARSGMGSSSAFAVGLIKVLLSLRGQSISARDLAARAIQLEQEVLRESVGSQDQIASAYGGFNVVRFMQNGEIEVTPVGLSGAREQELQEHLALFYVGGSRNGTVLAAKTIANIPKKMDELRRMRAMVDQAYDILHGNRSLHEFGKLLHEAWVLKCEVNKSVTNTPINRLYEKALKHGALGGKLLGSGGTGFAAFFVPPEKREGLIQALPGYIHIPFRFEREGSSLVQSDPRHAGQSFELAREHKSEQEAA